ncbi:MAG TPA: hypothetical protein VLR92_03175 [Blastocatellia bacterium]|nr:hypothetical protein [Blastocatellia bacterium]
MPDIRFCSKCGERIKLKRASDPFFRSFCPRCSSRFKSIRLALFAIPALSGAIGFAIGHYTSAREPFYLLGTPVDLTTSEVPSAAVNNGDHSFVGSDRSGLPDHRALSPGTAEAICGARTKSGKPCQRKVKGGGYCWQHRDKQAAKEKGPGGR